IDTCFQAYRPTLHLIIEPHPSVLAHARAHGWFEKPGVRFYEGTWQQWLKDLEAGKEEWVEFDAIYFDTYSEHYVDLRSFLSQTPNLLTSSSSSPTRQSSVSFFHGLGATSRAFYDVYTQVVELHMTEFGFKTTWQDVAVLDVGTEFDETGRDDRTTGDQLEGGDEEASQDKDKNARTKKYWEWEKAVGPYRLPICRLDYD
ncbi:hypothetical protein JCM10212_001006, partial [Sporobolomyces blumeae]